ncbi:MAG: hypothetical protein K2H02_00970 [Anaeroplasmataceae bacterium]|nr:hypothetical protein [Anaeroplasmataceae bacterium]MDE5867495.1 hypothetical protein [Anaeroplasmataceae bacterium]
MKMLTKDALNDIERQIYNKGRDIDVAIFNGLLDKENRDFVIDCLMLYVNKDGGFGSGLYIDNYNTNSSVYQTYEALRILDMLDIDKNYPHPILASSIQKIGNYLFNRCLLENDTWNPCIPSNKDFAHSMEMEYQVNYMKVWGAFPTQAILGYFLTLMDETKVYYKKTLKQLEKMFDYFFNATDLNCYDMKGFNSLLGSLKKTGLYPKEAQRMEEKLLKLGHEKLSDPDFDILTMLSNCTLDETLQVKKEEALDDLIEARKSHGLWEHTKDWGTKNYPEADSASLKWLGAETVSALDKLIKGGRVEL